jgi:hypothetical protein
MADVERAQLILVGGIAVAAAMVVVALVLNSAIFAGNLATRTGDADTTEILTSQGTAAESVGGVIEHVNTNNEANHSHGTLEGKLIDGVTDLNDLSNRQAAPDGTVTSISIDTVWPGMRIMQTNQSRNLSAGGSDAENWTLARDVTGTATFRLNITNSSLNESTYGTTKAAMANSSFHVAVNEVGTPGIWRIYVFEAAATDQTYVLVEKPGENFHGSLATYRAFATESCARTNTTFLTVDIGNALVDDLHCSQLEDLDDLDGPYHVSYNTTVETPPTLDEVARARGTYELFVDQPSVNLPSSSDPYFTDADGRSPFTRTAIYAATHRFTYESSTTSYEGSFTAGPATGGAPPGFTPPVAGMTVTDQSSEFDVDWSAPDADDDLEEVEVVLVENETDAEELNSKTTTVSSGSESGTTTFDGNVSSGTRYDIFVIASDANEGADVVTCTNVANGTDPAC